MIRFIIFKGWPGLCVWVVMQSRVAKLGIYFCIALHFYYSFIYFIYVLFNDINGMNGYEMR
jgi:hypothetical protein